MPFMVTMHELLLSMTRFESIFITGASSGLGAALALKLAKSDVQLFLTARREEKLKEIAEQCRYVEKTLVV